MSNLINNDFTISTTNSNLPTYMNKLQPTGCKTIEMKKKSCKVRDPKRKKQLEKMKIKQPKIVISTPFAHWSLTSFVQFLLPCCFFNILIIFFNTIQMKNQMFHK